MYDRIKMNVDGIIAPMVETSFGAINFREMLNKIHFYVKTLPEITSKIETRNFFDKRINSDSLKLNQMI